MKVKKNILKYKNPDTNEYTPIPIVVSGEDVSKKQDKTDNALVTENKTIVGAINETNERLNDLDVPAEVAIQSTQPTEQTIWINPNGSGNEIVLAEIDDDSVSEEKTWSSSKISEAIGEGGTGSSVELTVESISNALGVTANNVNDFMLVDANGNIVAKNISDIFSQLRCKIEIYNNESDVTTLKITSKGQDPLIYNLKLKELNDMMNNSNGLNNNYYIYDHTTLGNDAPYTINRFILQSLNDSVLPPCISFHYELTDVMGKCSNYIYDDLNGLSFNFGKFFVRITTNVAGGGAAEPV